MADRRNCAVLAGGVGVCVYPGVMRTEVRRLSGIGVCVNCTAERKVSGVTGRMPVSPNVTNFRHTMGTVLRAGLE